MSNNDDEKVDIFDDTEEEVIAYKYSISSYGADYVVDVVVSRLEKEIIFVPEFQRKFVWSQATASRFIESLLLGLPVPGIFLSKEPDSEKLLIIDGHQRLKTLQFFYGGIFKGKEFKLKNVQDRFEGKTIKTLEEDDKIRLGDSIIHATIIKQDEPSEDQSSIYHVFERLNTGGMILRAQEIRACIYHGLFNKLLEKLNGDEHWRLIYGNPSNRLKDQELILRFFALFYYLDEYDKPMKEFLNKYMAKNRNLEIHNEEVLSEKFKNVIDLIARTIGKKAFRLEATLNAAAYDAVMVGLARRLENGSIQNEQEITGKHEELIANEDFQASCKTATSNVGNVQKRTELAIAYFKDLQ